MYPSDYGYATSGGTTKDRAACLAKELSNWGSDFRDCERNDYLFTSGPGGKWTLTSSSASADSVFRVDISGGIGDVYCAEARMAQPALFLKSNISIKAGTGESSNPYQLKLGID